jgi:hypothetical protein
MGKYLDIARKFEARRREQETTVSVPQLGLVSTTEAKSRPYEQMAKAIADDCLALPSDWLIDRHPELWQRLVVLDAQVGELERQGETGGQDYCRVLERIVSTVREARHLYEQELRKEQ